MTYNKPFLFNKPVYIMSDKKERGAYEDSLKQYRDIKNVVDTAKEEGKEIGKEIGKKTRSIEIAKVLLSENLPLEMIARATKLSIEEIQKIADSLGKK